MDAQRTATAYSSPPGHLTGPEPLPPLSRVVGRRHVAWWLVTAVLVLLTGLAVNGMITNEALQWDVVGRYLGSQQILEGLARTIELTVIAMLVGIVLGAVLAVMRLSPLIVPRTLATAYIWFFRGTPLIVQIIFWYNAALLVPRLSIGIPGLSPWWSWSTNDLVTPFVAAVLALSLNEAAYMSEIVRAGILSVGAGQREAALALGMTDGLTMRRVVLPQAMRIVVPPTGNQVIGMLKSTALVSVTSLPELLYSAQLIYSRTFETIPLLIVVSLWYLALTTLLSAVQFLVERHYGRGVAQTGVSRWRGTRRAAANAAAGTVSGEDGR